MFGGLTPALLLAGTLSTQSIQRPVSVQHDGKPVAGAEVSCGAAKSVTGADGRTAVAVPAEGCTLVVTRDGLSTVTLPIKAEAAAIEVTLDEAAEVHEEVVVTATRTGRVASDQAMRVEVVTREEIEEKLLMTPGDIVMLLNETSGIRVQATSPALGGAGVRIQGLTGRYTAVLTDGLPLYNTQVASLGLLQIPPMDLRQVEVIKGAASALYGAAALGGVINLVTRLPTDDHAGELLLNATSRKGSDAILWLSGPAPKDTRYTLLAGGHGQVASDVDGDAWADVPRYRRFVLRPRLVVDRGSSGAEVSAGYTAEVRTGGFVDDAFVQGVDTHRADVGGSARWRAGQSLFTIRASTSSNAHGHQYGDVHYGDRHRASFAEVAATRQTGRHLFVAGAAFDGQSYRNDELPVFDYAWATPGLFVQDDVNLHRSWLLSISARVDWHSEYGTFFSPRLSTLVRLRGWEFRGAVGQGFSAPTVLTDETDEVGLHHVLPPPGLAAERGLSWSFDGSRAFGWIEISASAFGSRIQDALAVTDEGSALVLTNRPGDTKTAGAEIFARVRFSDVVVTASHAWTNATEVEPDAARVTVPLTPARAWGVIAAWERHGVARVGLEIYRTGRQRLDDNPYSENSVPYTIFGLLAERRFGRYRLFVNFENLTDVRQTQFAPLLRPVPTATGRYTVDAWAPLDGRTVNGGVRIAF